MNAREILVAARALIAEPERWTTKYYARESQDGRFEIDPIDPAASCFCTYGACRKVAGLSLISGSSPEYHRACEMLSEALPPPASVHAYGWTLSKYNDHNTHADVVALFDRAIAAASVPA